MGVVAVVLDGSIVLRDVGGRGSMSAAALREVLEVVDVLELSKA